MTMNTTTSTTLPSFQGVNHDLKELADLYSQTQSMTALHKACEEKIRNENMNRYFPKPDSHAIC